MQKDSSQVSVTNLGHTIMKKGFWLYLFSYIIGPLWYLTRIIISKTISIEEVWILYSIIGFIGLLSAYNGLWLTESLKYFIPKYFIEKKYNAIKTTTCISLWIQLLTSIPIILMLFFGGDWLGEHYFHSAQASEILQYFCLYFLGINILIVIDSIFLAFQDTFSTKIIEFIRTFGILLFTAIFFFSGHIGIESYALSWILGLGISLVVGVAIFASKYFKIFQKGTLQYDKTELKLFYRYSFWTFISMNVGILLGAIDQQMIIVMLGPKAAGYYANYISLFHIFTILITPLFVLLLPLFTELITKKDRVRLKALQDFLYNYFWVFSLSMGAISVALGPEIATTLFGENFRLSGILLSCSSLFFVFNALLIINFNILASMGKVRTKTFIALAVAGVNISLNLLLLPQVGVYGAVISTVIWRGLLWYFSFRIINKHCPISFEWKFIIKNSLTFLVLCSLLYLFKGKVFGEGGSTLTNIMKLWVIGLSYYGIIALVNWGKIITFKEQIKKLRS